MKGLQAYVLSKKYTADTADSLGSLKGAACQIDSIVYDQDEGTVTITFSWEGESGQIQTDTAVLRNGEEGEPGEQGIPGLGIKSTKIRTIDGKKHLIVTYDDDSTEDAGILPEGGGGGSSELEDDLTTSVTVGGISSGKTYEAGTSLETLFRDMLNPVAYPTLTNPSATLSATGAKLLETGATLNTTFTLTLNRGSINPQYTAESSYRSGAATGYTFDGETTTTNTFAKTITSAKTSYQGSIAYAQGCQPKDSTGKDYQSPLPAGSVNSNVINYEFVDALWANTANIATVAKLALVSKSAKLKQFDFPAQTAANPEIFDVPASGWNITALEVLNTLSNQWEDCSAEFAITDTSHEDASGTTVAYKRYTCALGYATGARKIRIKWS
jgi:hypothetical protein